MKNDYKFKEIDLTAKNRANTIYRVKAQGRAALLFAYLKLNTQLMDNRRAKGEFCPLVRRFPAFMGYRQNN